MIIVAFLLPLSLYFLALSWVNRQSRPVVVAGTWDFVGLLFASSGFLLVGGPAVLSSFNERWRKVWLLGESGSLPDNLDGYRELWMLLAAVYFLLIVVGSGAMLMHRRRLTCIYNVEPMDVEAGLEDACKRLGVSPIRTGNLFVFGFANDPTVSPMPQPRPGEPHAILEVESSGSMKHVSLRWEPHDSPLRATLESDLCERLDRTAAPVHDASVWCNLLGTTLLLVSLFVLVVLVARQYFLR